jgi:hypothetical protein
MVIDLGISEGFCSPITVFSPLNSEKAVHILDEDKKLLEVFALITYVPSHLNDAALWFTFSERDRARVISFHVPYWIQNFTGDLSLFLFSRVVIYTLSVSLLLLLLLFIYT